MEIFIQKMDRLIRELSSVGIEYAILRSKDTLTYLFCEIYSPPPEEIGILAIGIEVPNKSVKVYSSILDYYRVKELYGRIDFVDVVPVYRGGIRNLAIDRKVLDIEEYHKELKDVAKKYRRVAYDIVDDLKVESLGEIAIDIRRLIKRLRRTKLKIEIEAISKAVHIAERAIEIVLSEITPGLTESGLAGKLELVARELGAEGFAFNTIVAIGSNAAKPHHIPSNNRFSGKEPILIDFGVRIGGYVSDITRIIIPRGIGKEYEEIFKVIEAVSEGIDRALKISKTGMTCSDIDSEVRAVLNSYGGLDKYFIHGLGHGIGIDVHEEPRIGPGSKHVLEEGNVITIEPGIYVWGKYGVRIEEDVAIVEGIAKPLTRIRRILEL